MTLSLLVCVVPQLLAQSRAATTVAQGLQVDFESGAVVLQSSVRDNRTWGLKLHAVRLGRTDESCDVAPAGPSFASSRVEFDRGALREWFVDGAHGLEHGFTLFEAPQGAGEIELALAVNSDLRARVLEGRRDVDFVDADGTPVLGYFGLHVEDAGGVPLDAQWRTGHGELVLVVDDHGARYPLTIDPTFIAYGGSFSRALNNFGAQVALSDQTAFVGSRYSGPFGSGSSTASFYERATTGWMFDASFNGTAHYSSEVDVSGDFAVVGAPQLADLLYIYQRVAGTWSLAQTISGYTDGHDWYGHAVAIDGDYCAVTAPNALYANGTIAIHRRSGASWTPHTLLQDPNGSAAGESLDMSLPYVIAGEPNYGSQERGRAQVWLVPGVGGSGPNLTYLLAPDGANDNRFGTSVAIDGSRAVVGAPFHNHGATTSGGAYVFDLVGTTWTFRTELVPSIPTANEALGYAVAIDGDRVVGGGNGVAYVYELVAGVWTQLAKLTPPTGSTRFGRAVAIEGTHVLIGAPDMRTVFSYELGGAPAPQVYCTAKVNSQGCTPAIGWSGVASASLTQPFFVNAREAINNKAGTLFYGTSGPIAAPFQGGWQCVAAPRRRTGVVTSGGNAPPDDCSGAYAYDFNARVQSGVDPALVAGVVVDAQYWTRDGAASFQTGLSIALEFTVGP